MNKNVLILGWTLGFALLLGAQEHIRLISDIGLIDGRTGTTIAPPSTLVMGITVNLDVLFKLSDDGGVIKAGQFLKGFNTFGLDVHNRFERSGTYAYTLELKAGSYLVQKDFKIDIRIDLPKEPEENKEPIPAKSEHVVSMYVGGQLVVSYRKLHTAKLFKDIASIPRPYSINPYDSSAEPSPNAGGVSILSAAAAALQAITGLLSKKDEEEPLRPVVTKTQITKRFIRIDPSGAERTATAVISLWIEKDFF
jgi:hypothetical protein